MIEYVQKYEWMGILILILIAVLSGVMPVRAANETSFDQISELTLNNLTYDNQTINIIWPNNSVAYRIDTPPLVVQAVPLGLDLQIQMMIVQTFFIVMIGLVVTIRAVYDLMSWINARRSS